MAPHLPHLGKGSRGHPCSLRRCPDYRCQHLHLTGSFLSDRKESRIQSGVCIKLLHLGEMTAKGKISVSLLTLEV